MDIKELCNELKNNKIKESTCLINPPFCIEGALCLKQEDNGSWSVIFVERGEYLTQETFKSENDACRFFLKKALLDPTNRIDFKQSDLIDFKEHIKEVLNKYGL